VNFRSLESPMQLESSKTIKIIKSHELCYIPTWIVIQMYWSICFATFLWILWGSYIKWEPKSTTKGMYGWIQAEYNNLQNNCWYEVTSPCNVEHLAYNLTPYWKAVGDDSQTSMWNLWRRSRASLGEEGEIPLFTNLVSQNNNVGVVILSFQTSSWD